MKAVYGIVIVVLLLVLAVPSGLDSCAIGPPEPVFVARTRPSDRDAFLKGKVPVLQRTYSGRDLITAFRVLSGRPLTTGEVASVYSESPRLLPDASANQVWAQARNRVPGTQPMFYIDPYRTITSAGSYQVYFNCHSDAFAVATQTLDEVITRWGAADPRTAAWLKAQDQVFENCSAKEPTIPADPPAGSDELFADYRRYQIAAAYFYFGNFREARERFHRISEDPDSPWREYGLYLEARSLLRAGSVNGDHAAFEEGRGLIERILADPAKKEWHESCSQLLQYLTLRAEPRKRLAELGEALQQVRDEGVSQETTDFLFLVGPRSPRIRTMADAEVSEIGAWVLAVSGNPADAASASMAWWRKQQSPVWLVAALMNAEDSDSAELVSAARKIPADSPAYESAGYFAIEREIRAGHAAEAREWADRMLAAKLTASTRNQVLELRMKLAQSWEDFLKSAPRLPERNFELYDDREQPGHEFGDQTELMEDAQQILNRQVPLTLWQQAVQSPLIPRSIQVRLAFSGWLRAVMLGRNADARQFLQRAVELQPESGPVAKEFLDAKDRDGARFAAVRLVLRAPLICPSAPNFEIDEVKLAEKHGDDRRSCWGSADDKEKPLPAASFLSDAQRAQGTKESEQVYSQPAWQATVLLRETVAWAVQHPDDPRVPETLHDAVLAGRYRRTDAETGTYAKRAFDLLHRRYPKSTWTAQTPYWYK